jgi:hypothetical protein
MAGADTDDAALPMDTDFAPDHERCQAAANRLQAQEAVGLEGGDQGADLVGMGADHEMQPVATLHRGVEITEGVDLDRIGQPFHGIAQVANHCTLVP